MKGGGVAEKKIKKRTLFLLGLSMFFTVSILFLFFFQSETPLLPPSSDMRHGRIGVYHGEASLLLFIADKEGFYERHGLDLTVVPYPTGRDAMAGMLNGEVDYANCTEFVVVKNSFRRVDFKILASITEGDINGLLAKKSSGIETPADLKGKTIGTTIGTLTEYLTGVFLDQYQLAWNDVRIVHVEHDKRYEAIADPQIDALFAWEPYLYNLRKAYPRELNYFPMPAGFPFYFVLVVNQAFHEKNPEISAGILRALHETEVWAIEHPERVFRYAQDLFDNSKSYTAYSLTRHNFDITFPYTLPRMMSNEAKWLVDNHIVKEKSHTDIWSLFDSSILEEIKPESITIIE